MLYSTSVHNGLTLTVLYSTCVHHGLTLTVLYSTIVHYGLTLTVLYSTSVHHGLTLTVLYSTIVHYGLTLTVLQLFHHCTLRLDTDRALFHHCALRLDTDRALFHHCAPRPLDTVLYFTCSYVYYSAIIMPHHVVFETGQANQRLNLHYISQRFIHVISHITDRFTLTAWTPSDQSDRDSERERENGVGCPRVYAISIVSVPD